MVFCHDPATFMQKVVRVKISIRIVCYICEVSENECPFCRDMIFPSISERIETSKIMKKNYIIGGLERGSLLVVPVFKSAPNYER